MGYRFDMEIWPLQYLTAVQFNNDVIFPQHHDADKTSKLENLHTEWFI